MTTTQLDVEGLAVTTTPGPTTTLFVCTSCASTWEKGQRVGTSGGTRLLAALQEKYDQLPEEQRRLLTIQPTPCMSACSHACAVSFSAPGKHQYLFGDLPHEGEAADTVCDAVFECAALYGSKADGMMGWSDRPEPLKRGVIARMPPVPQNLLQTLRRDSTDS